MNRPQARTGLRTTIGLVAALGLVGALAMPAFAGHVTPTPINEGNPTCSSFDANWTELKVEGADLGNGTVTDGTLEVTISNFSNDDPKGFDWESNIGVDAVFVKAGSDKHNLYVYDPEATADEGLGPQDGQGNGISHISFCYDEEEDEEPTPTPTPTEEPTEEPTEAPTEEPTEAPTEEPTEAPTATVNEGELGGNPTATPAGGSLPDTAVGQFGQVPATVLSLVLLGALAAMVYVRLARQR